MNKIAVVQGLQAKIGELQVAFRQQASPSLSGRNRQGRRQQFKFYTFFDVRPAVPGVQRVHVVLGCSVGDAKETSGLARRLSHNRRAATNVVIGLLLDQGARGDHQRGAQFRLAYPVIEVFEGFIEDFASLTSDSSIAGLAHDGMQTVDVQRGACCRQPEPQ